MKQEFKVSSITEKKEKNKKTKNDPIPTLQPRQI